MRYSKQNKFFCSDRIYLGVGEAESLQSNPQKYMYIIAVIFVNDNFGHVVIIFE
jgi:hypothetical protein